MPTKRFQVPLPQSGCGEIGPAQTLERARARGILAGPEWHSYSVDSTSVVNVASSRFRGVFASWRCVCSVARAIGGTILTDDIHEPESLLTIRFIESLRAIVPNLAVMLNPRIEPVLIDTLLPADSPRHSAVDEQYARLLADRPSLPPILVQRTTMRIIDGMHRVRAMEMQGHEAIAVQFAEADDDAAFILSVLLNVSKGLRLSVRERRAAAERLISRHPDWSDRTISKISGLSAKVVARLRACSTAQYPHLNERIGRDGKRHPLDTADARRRAVQILQREPAVPLRRVAADAGLSLGTAHKVKAAFEERRRQSADAGKRSPAHESGSGAGQAGGGRGRRAGVHDEVRNNESSAIDHLAADPALRYTEVGRQLIRWLRREHQDLRLGRRILEGVPSHCSTLIAAVAREHAAWWLEVAHSLDARTR